ncbi:MAG: recombinase family protein [bacterium]|nr:recombinase family protein [bacterium]
MKTAEDIKKTLNLIAVYARVSTAKQEEDGTIETQLLAVREFAKKNGYTIVKEYIDDGWSGDILARPQLDQLRQDAKSKIWEAVLAYDPDRLARRYSYQELVMDELREAGVEVLFVTTPSPKNGEEKILHGVKGLFAEYERVKIAERFRLGKLRKVKEGHILVSEAPYGLTYVSKKDGVQGYYEINEEEIRNLKKIFSLVDEGMTLRGVVKKLQELRIRPRKSKRGVWSTSTLSHILRNKTFIGEATYGKSYAVVPENPINTEKYKKMRKTSRKIRPDNEWITIPVPPILDRDLFMRVQERLRTNFELCERNRKNEYLLAGRTWCVCGYRRTGEGPQHGKYLYYRCTSKVHTFPFPSECREKGINARIADKMVWQRIAKLMSSPELLTAQMNNWLKKRHNGRQNGGVAVEDMRKDILKLKEQEDRYNKAYGAGLFPIEKLREYAIPIRDRVAAIESQIAESETERRGINEAVLPKPHEVEVFCQENIRTLHGLNFEAKRVIVMDTVEKIIGSQQELKVSGYIPVENHVKLQTVHRNSRSS